MQKYTHPKAYFPDCDQGSTVLASISPAGLLELYGMLMRLSSTGADLASELLRSCAAATSSNRSNATPARLAKSSTRAGISTSVCGFRDQFVATELRRADIARGSHWPLARQPLASERSNRLWCKCNKVASFDSRIHALRNGSRSSTFVARS